LAKRKENAREKELGFWSRRHFSLYG